jgi:hypothetical protein
MAVHAWQGIMVVLTALSLIMGCASSPYIGTGAALGGGVGALAGAAINNRNPWSGAAVGGLVGSVLGAAGGYAVQQRQTYQQPQGYYQPQPGYGAPPAQGYNSPPAYGYNAPPAGPNYSYNQPPASPSPNYGYSSDPPVAGNQGREISPPQPEGCRTPMTYAPYYYQQGAGPTE